MDEDDWLWWGCYHDVMPGEDDWDDDEIIRRCDL